MKKNLLSRMLDKLLGREEPRVAPDSSGPRPLNGQTGTEPRSAPRTEEVSQEESKS